MTYSKPEEPLFPVKTRQSSSYLRTVSEPQTSSSLASESKPVKQEKPPEEISVLLVGLNGEVEDIVKKVFGDIRVDHVEPGYNDRQDLHKARDKIYDCVNGKKPYQLVISNAETVDTIHLNTTVNGCGGKTIAFGILPRHEKTMVKINTRARIAEDHAQLEAELNKYKGSS